MNIKKRILTITLTILSLVMIASSNVGAKTNATANVTSKSYTYYANKKVKTQNIVIKNKNKKVRAEVINYTTAGKAANSHITTYSNDKILARFYYHYKGNKRLLSKVVYYYNTHTNKKVPLAKPYKTNLYNSKGQFVRPVFYSAQAKRDEIVAVAKKQNRKKYSYGSAGPNRFDCSGLTSYVYNSAIGKKIGRSTYNQVKVSKKVVKADTKNLVKGDLLFWGSRNAPYHTGIYLGNGQYIHASTPSTGVKIEKIKGSFKPSFAKRVV